MCETPRNEVLSAAGFGAYRIHVLNGLCRYLFWVHKKIIQNYAIVSQKKTNSLLL